MHSSRNVLIAIGAIGLAALLSPAANAQTTFSNNSLITLTDDPTPSQDGNVQPATPYPSTINVTGLTGVISKVTVTLNNINHTFLRDLDILLVGPSGQSVILMSDAGGGTPVSNLTLTFDDAAPSPIFEGTAPVTGTWLPTNYSGFSENPDIFPSSAPPGPWGSTLSVFNGTAPNGTYSLYAVDDGNGDSGTIANGWSITITTAAAAEAPEPGSIALALCGMTAFGVARRRRSLK